MQGKFFSYRFFLIIYCILRYICSYFEISKIVANLISVLKMICWVQKKYFILLTVMETFQKFLQNVFRKILQAVFHFTWLHCPIKLNFPVFLDSFPPDWLSRILHTNWLYSNAFIVEIIIYFLIKIISNELFLLNFCM